MTSEIAVFGVGSPHGDEDIGWRIVERLRHSTPAGVWVQAVRQPLEILGRLARRRCVWILDVCQGLGSPGEIMRLTWPDPRIAESVGLSSHGMNLHEVLSLAREIDRLPHSTVIYAIEIDDSIPSTGVDQRAALAALEVERRVLSEIKLGAPRRREREVAALAAW